MRIHEAGVPCRVADTGGACPQRAADRRDSKRIAQSISGRRPGGFADAGNLAAVVCRGCRRTSRAARPGPRRRRADRLLLDLRALRRGARTAVHQLLALRIECIPCAIDSWLFVTKGAPGPPRIPGPKKSRV